jgi:hypothetical protein
MVAMPANVSGDVFLGRQPHGFGKTGAIEGFVVSIHVAGRQGAISALCRPIMMGYRARYREQNCSSHADYLPNCPFDWNLPALGS